MDHRDDRQGGGKAVDILSGIANLLEKLGDLADTGAELKRTGELRGGKGEPVKGVFGFNVRMGLGKEGEEPRVKVEPFGNVGRNPTTGEAEVHETREPMVDVFDENDHLLLVAEMPGVGEGDVTLELTDDILTIRAEVQDRRYYREEVLPFTPAAGSMTHGCNNGVLEVRIPRPAAGEGGDHAGDAVGDGQGDRP